MRLAILYSSRDVWAALPYLREKDVVVAASGVDTFLTLKKLQIPFNRVSNFYRMDKKYLWSIRNKAFTISSKFFLSKKVNGVTHSDIDIPQFIHSYFKLFILKIIQDQDAVDAVLHQFHPSEVIISNRLNEGLFRKTHQSTFTLFNQLMICSCQKRGVRLVFLPPLFPTSENHLVSQIIRVLLEAIINSVKSFFHFAKTEYRTKKKFVVFSASNHQLTNEKELVNLLSKNFELFTIGKLKITEQSALPFHWNFHPVNNIASQLNALDYIRNIFFSSSIFIRYLFFARGTAKNYFKKSFHSDFFEFIDPTLLYFYSASIIEIHRNYLYLKKILEKNNCAFVLTSNTIDPLNAALLNLSIKKDIPYVLLIHDAQGNTFFDYNFLSTDNFFVWGKYQKHLIKNDLPDSRCFVTGNPDFDKYRNLSEKNKHPKITAYRRLLLVILTCYNPFIMKPNDETLLGVLKIIEQKIHPRFPRLAVVVKGHPTDDHRVLKQVVEQTISTPVKFSKTDTEELIDKADIVLTQSTSAGIRAILRYKPTIYLNVGEYQNYEPYAQGGAALGVYHLKQLPAAVNLLMRNPNHLETGQRHFISSYCYRIDGQASKRIAEVITKLSS